MLAELPRAWTLPSTCWLGELLCGPATQQAWLAVLRYLPVWANSDTWTILNEVSIFKQEEKREKSKGKKRLGSASQQLPHCSLLLSLHPALMVGQDPTWGSPTPGVMCVIAPRGQHGLLGPRAHMVLKLWVTTPLGFHSSHTSHILPISYLHGDS